MTHTPEPAPPREPDLKRLAYALTGTPEPQERVTRRGPGMASLHATGEPRWLVDGEGATLEANAALVALLGCTAAHVETQGLLDYVHRDDSAAACWLLDADARGCRATLRLQRCDGSSSRVRARAAATGSGHVLLALFPG